MRVSGEGLRGLGFGGFGLFADNGKERGHYWGYTGLMGQWFLSCWTSFS